MSFSHGMAVRELQLHCLLVLAALPCPALHCIVVHCIAPLTGGSLLSKLISDRCACRRGASAHSGGQGSRHQLCVCGQLCSREVWHVALRCGFARQLQLPQHQLQQFFLFWQRRPEQRRPPEWPRGPRQPGGSRRSGRSWRTGRSRRPGWADKLGSAWTAAAP